MICNSVAGCRTTSSDHHKALPFIIKSHKKLAEFTREPNKLRLGYQFLWGVKQPYQVNAGKVTMVVEPNMSVNKVPEIQRVNVLVTGLQQHYGDNYTVSTSSGCNSARFCQFAGGGDIEIVCNDVTRGGASAALLVQVEGQEETEEEQQEHQLQHTPPNSQQTDEEVTKQLMANMVLLGATRLQQLSTSKPPEEVAEFNDLVIYGCQFSPVHSLKLLKLSIDFNETLLVLRTISSPSMSWIG